MAPLVTLTSSIDVNAAPRTDNMLVAFDSSVYQRRLVRAVKEASPNAYLNAELAKKEYNPRVLSIKYSEKTNKICVIDINDDTYVITVTNADAFMDGRSGENITATRGQYP